MELKKLLVEFREDSLKHAVEKLDLIKLKNDEVKYDGSYMNDVDQLQLVLNYCQKLIDNEKNTNELIVRMEEGRKAVVDLFKVIALPPNMRVKVHLHGDSYADFWYVQKGQLLFGDSYSI